MGFQRVCGEGGGVCFGREEQKADNPTERYRYPRKRSRNHSRFTLICHPSLEYRQDHPNKSHRHHVSLSNGRPRNVGEEEW